ncbi:sigma-70 family RNA polymerase sigma factor [Clostridium bornimense]|uniref:sigma-70 family RNA polymerase sigma factor n=1 Tax=Clostridium bornimense TaxID=1216932 RepID=UPI001C121171|nr:sigma-70 family RNA polymerase sigma factor [Clostridium bornimense]MBU5317429.1 sigma-70 family RNA polymerase sigma factor [Clostridium bornimense]
MNIKLAKNGDKLAVEEILESFKKFIIKQCNKIYIEGYDKEDLIQEGYISLIKAIEKYDETKGNFVAYGTRAIVNNYYMMIRNRAKYNGTASLNKSNDENIELIDIIEGNENIEEKIILKEDVKSVIEAINNFSDDDKKLIINLQISKIPGKQLAKELGISYLALCKRKERALKKLRLKLENK